MFTCQSCGVVLPGRKSRKYCSVGCQRASDRERHIAEWLNSGAVYVGSRAGHYIRRYILDEQAGCCSICSGPSEWCGKPLNFVLDHVDGNSADNRRENLRLVCPNCDSQLATYKGRNRGRGRASRRERYANGQSY